MLRDIKIGDILLAEKLVTEAQIKEAIELQKTVRKKLGATLIDLGYITEDQMLTALSKQLEIPLIDLATFPIDPLVTTKLPESYARLYHCILLKRELNGYLVGMADPLDIIAYDEISKLLKEPISVAIINAHDLEKNLGQIYRRAAQISGYAGELGESILHEADQLDVLLSSQEVDPPVRKFILALFEDALQINASDIHIEPGEKVLRIRLRVDGVLQEQILDQKNIAAAVAQHLKLMAKLNIAEKRLPQDGRFTIKTHSKIIDIRLSTMPVVNGESIVMRLLDQSSPQIEMSKNGMPHEMLKSFREIINKPHGVILVTGPTGSGKTTTLYGALMELNDEHTKIVTIEDPVEYKLERVCQVQVEPKINLDFARVLRSVLRQDPDIILVGEMRDQETARIAMRAALTGHLVLSTLHTNDAASTATRLVDMGVEGYLVAGALEGVLAQRLIRKNCEHCKAPYELSEAEKAWLDKFESGKFKDHTFYKGRGCTYCNSIGFSGRRGVYELLVMTDEMLTLLAHEEQTEFMALARKTMQGKQLIDMAIDLALKKITTVSEVMQISGA